MNVEDARAQARTTGKQVPIGNTGMVAFPNGWVGTPGGGFGSVGGLGEFVQPVQSQATYLPASQTAYPSAATRPDFPAGPSLAPPPLPTPSMPPTPAPVNTPYIPPGGPGAYATGALGRPTDYIPMQAYGPPAPAAGGLPPAHHMIAAALNNQLTTDWLNQQSLAAARQGINYVPPGAANPIPTNR